MRDKVLICIQCNNAFVFTVTEQEHFLSMGFDPPRRCPSCRKNKFKESEIRSRKNNKYKKKHFHMKYDENTEE